MGHTYTHIRYKTSLRRLIYIFTQGQLFDYNEFDISCQPCWDCQNSGMDIWNGCMVLRSFRPILQSKFQSGLWRDGSDYFLATGTRLACFTFHWLRAKHKLRSVAVS